MNIAVFKAGAVILGEGVGHENIGAYLAAPLDFHLHTLDIGYLFKMLAFFDFGKTGTEHILAVFKVLEVAALDLRGNDNAGGDMRKSDGRGGLVDLLTACTLRTVDIHLDVLLA